MPALTSVVFVVTAAVNVVQLIVPGLLTDLERTLEGQHGDWWRTATTLFVQDGGIAGMVSNLLFLLVLGAAAEQVASRGRWIAGYLGAALAGELAGYAWQPVGGGNSVANCGLAAILIIAMLRDDARMAPFGPPAALLWAGVLLATWWYPLVVVGIVAAGAGRAKAEWSNPWHGRAALGFVAAIGVFLCAVRNIHGAAMLAGLVIAVIPGRRRGDRLRRLRGDVHQVERALLAGGVGRVDRSGPVQPVLVEGVAVAVVRGRRPAG